MQRSAFPTLAPLLNALLSQSSFKEPLASLLLRLTVHTLLSSQVPGFTGTVEIASVLGAVSPLRQLGRLVPC